MNLLIEGVRQLRRSVPTDRQVPDCQVVLVSNEGDFGEGSVAVFAEGLAMGSTDLTGHDAAGGPPPGNRPAGMSSALGRPFWEAAAEGRLVVQQCDSCRQLRHYPQERCPNCHSDTVSWAEVSGHGQIYSFTVTYQGFHPWWATQVPYAVVTVELDEGLRMVSDLPCEDLGSVAIGLPVEVFFDRVADGITLPRFRIVH